MFRKKKFLFFVMVIIAVSSGCNQSQSHSKQINFSGAFALYPLNLKWSDEYKKSHPDIFFNIQPGGAG
jgi:phosphate transport system substrate-binding protein